VWLLLLLLLLGHVPMLADPTFAEMVQAIRSGQPGAGDKLIWHLTKVGGSSRWQFWAPLDAALVFRLPACANVGGYVVVGACTAVSVKRHGFSRLAGCRILHCVELTHLGEVLL